MNGLRQQKKERCFKMRNYRNAFICILMILTLLGCTTQQKNAEKDAYYLSFNVVKQSVIEVYTYDVTTKKVEKKAEVPNTSQYPLATYAYREETLYYSARTNPDIHLDDLYSHHIKTSEIEKLTDSLFALNAIIPQEDHIDVVAVPKDSKNLALHLYTYDHSKLSSFIGDDDFNVWQCNNNPRNQDLLISGYATSEDQYRIDHQDEKEFVNPKNTIYVKHGGELQKLYQTQDGERVDTLCFTDKNTYIYQIYDQIYELNGTSQKVLAKLSDLHIQQLIYQQDDILYYISKDNNVCAYSFETEKAETLYHCDNIAYTVQNAYMLKK